MQGKLYGLTHTASSFQLPFVTKRYRASLTSEFIGPVALGQG